ncbi:MAG: glycosyltransferase family 1 protein [Calditrichaeota bacterium]|nr:MAG: glycosyltransferase family 1 protein [Calditrichota bacterium]
MHYLGNIKVIPELPEELSRLKELAYNFYFSWSPEARELFRAIDAPLWTKVNHNPIKFLREVQQKELERCARDPEYLSNFKKVMVEFDQYMNPKTTWFEQNFPEYKDKTIAYFSAEIGVHESLPVYAGGLGVLAGDHLKSASDLGAPLVGVTLYYHQTYFTQQIDAHHNQIALYIPYYPEDLPLLPVLKEDGSPLIIQVPVADHTVHLRIWKAQVGRVPIFLLDANLPENSTEDRLITSRLYGGDQEMRISQEVVLGMGGVMALKAMGIEAHAWHMNEGHSVFLALERIRDLMKTRGLTFPEAIEAVSASTIFTTHTPVPAGNDAFPLHFVDKYFQKYWESLGVRRYQFIELGSQAQPEGYEIFNLTVLALKLSKFRNGVSKLHGEVSRKMWQDVWPGIPEDEIPISHITNGVHLSTWTVFRMMQLFDKYLGKNWRESYNNLDFWKAIHDIPDEVLWETKQELKLILLQHIRERIEAQYQRNKVGTHTLRRLKGMLNPNALTIGFARRFATYKRATLLFRNVDRLKRILNNPARPIQIIFAGKAHPKDVEGQALIRKISEYSMSEEFRGKIFFVENYDMSLARDLVAGVDIWLNNPRRPKEASGTSGQKAALNATVNFSVLDGWWNEAYNGKNGFAFGDREDYHNLEELDDWDSEALYDLLELEILPLFFKRDENDIPREWIKIMKNSIASIAPVFNSHRMVVDYIKQMYIPAIQNGLEVAAEHFKKAKEFSSWREQIEQRWSQIRLTVDTSDGFNSDVVLKYNQPFTLRTIAHLGAISPDEVLVQVYLVNQSEKVKDVLQSGQFELVEMKMIKTIEEGKYLYEATIVPSNSGNYRYAVRVLPQHPLLSNPTELGLVHWLEPETQ